MATLRCRHELLTVTCGVCNPPAELPPADLEDLTGRILARRAELAVAASAGAEDAGGGA